MLSLGLIWWPVRCFKCREPYDTRAKDLKWKFRLRPENPVIAPATSAISFSTTNLRKFGILVLT